jgi:hypothetical protein
MTLGEQFGGRLFVGLKPGTRRLWKRWSSKARRRLERELGEDAPRVRRFSGWAD